jgi:hypothetical protein
MVVYALKGKTAGEVIKMKWFKELLEDYAFIVDFEVLED